MKIHNFKFATILGIFLSFSLLGIDYLSAQTVWLDQLDLSTATQGYGIPMKNKSIDGKTLTIAGQTFERGVEITFIFHKYNWTTLLNVSV